MSPSSRKTLPPPLPPSFPHSVERHAKAVRSSFPPDLPRDAPERVRQLHQRRQLMLHETLLSVLYEAVVVTDHAGQVTHFNPAAEHLFGRSIADVRGTTIFRYFEAEGEGPQQISNPIMDGVNVHDKRVIITRPDGTRVVALLSVMPVRIGTHIVRVVGVFRDLTDIERANEELAETNQELARANHELKRLNEELETRAMVNDKTGLLNERAFMAELQRARASALRYDESLAVVYLDLSRFKVVNDTYGHDAGDTALFEFGQRLREAVYSTDIVAHLHGDEFAVLMLKPRGDGIEGAIRKIADFTTFRTSFPHPQTHTLDGVTIRARIGYVFRTGKNIPSEKEMLRLADQALLQTKTTGLPVFGDMNDAPPSVLPPPDRG